MVENKREEAAKQALEDVRHLIGKGSSEEGSQTQGSSISSEKLIALLEANFSKLDPNGDGISREELLTAITSSYDYSAEECEMIRLIAKYFDTIINLSDDEPGEEMRLTRMDMEVLKQFLLNSGITVDELHMWCNLGDSPDNITGGPPLTSA